MPSKIKATWAGLHASDKQALIQSKEAGSQTKAHNHRETVVLSKFPTHHHSISVDGEQFEVDIPDMVKSVLIKSLEALMKKPNRPMCLKSLFYFSPDIWMQPLPCLHQAEAVAAPVVDGVKTRTMMNASGQFVAQEWQNGSANRLSVTGVDSISFIIT